MGLLKKRKAQGEKEGYSVVQTARGSAISFGALSNYVPLSAPENALYDAIREAVPVVDAALEKIVRLVGTFAPSCGNSTADRLLERFFDTVPVAGGGNGIQLFVASFLNSLLCYGNAAGEMVLSGSRDRIALLYNAPLENLEILQNSQTLRTELCVREGVTPRPVAHPELILHAALNPKCGEVRGTSLLHSLPFVCSVLLKIYNSIGQNFERVGNLRFAVTYKPGESAPDKAYAKERAMQIAKEWADAMSTGGGRVKDFIAVGDVSIKVIGADNQVLDTQVPVRQMLEQIVAKTGIPPFMLGLSWSTTERMSTQQADMLTSELESYRRLVTPAILQIARMHLRLNGFACEPGITWETINLQDTVEEARARLLLAQAKKLERELKGVEKNG
ncbi:phage portal protein [Acetanaerobacterium elongatum]|uniref:Phage portal protein, HK97 family n=1 Tax=Acetanaerobacterium elongatum TaxID=258515 RepID=A0A1H0EM34_9FIRM|nr:phage portal protein [Acetanaerobacterium elongatum]SDN83478.1 hypothetical protein SAMN05192585_13432 [Acetanaerobacterium elongatum]